MPDTNGPPNGRRREAIAHLWHVLAAPRSLDEDEARQEHMTRIVLIILGLLFIPATILILAAAASGSLPPDTMLPTVFLDLIWLSGWWFVQHGRWRIGTYVPLIVLILPALYASYMTGPQTTVVLFYGVAIVLSGMLQGVRTQWSMLAMVSLAYLVSVWRYEPGSINALLRHGIPVIGSLTSLAFIQWFYIRQMEQSLAHIRAADEALRQARDELELRVEARTAELKAANVELAKAARHKDEFLANMSHELRTPLNSMLILTENLRTGIYGIVGPKQTRALTTMQESGKQLLAMINTVLDMAKIDAGTMKLSIGPVRIAQVAERSIRVIEAQAARKELQIVRRFLADAPLIQADERSLLQILTNLLSNAVKFTPNGGQIGLEMMVEAQTGNVRLSVWDTGIGIAREDLARLFQPFVQLDSGLARRYEGTGLGLILVKRLVELHGGTLSVQSEPGKGSTFTICLPQQNSDGGRLPGPHGETGRNEG